MNLCMGSLLWLKCHLHNKTPPCFLCWFSNNTVSYTVGISPTACTKSAIFRRFFYAVAKIGHHTHYIKKLAFRQGFFWCFLFFITKKLSPTYPQSYPQFFLFKNVGDKSYPQIVDNLCITLWIIQKTILKPLILRQTFFCGYWG